MTDVRCAEDLYGLPLERFIAERAALAKALRAQKRREEAGEVAARRKPSVAAWAVNQLIRTQRQPITELFAAGDDLADAQASAAEGRRTAEQMRGAMRRQRDAIDALVTAARGLLSEDGHPLSPQTLERVTDTLRAASIDLDSRAQVQSGCLTQELRFAGLGIGELGGPGLTPAPRASAKPAPGDRAPDRKRPAKDTSRAPGAANAKSPRAKPAPAGRDADAETESDAEARARAEARAEAAARADAQAERERSDGLRLARRVEREARRAATRAEKEHAAAESRRDAARAALEEAEERLQEATATHESAQAELEAAQQAVQRLESEAG